MKGSWPKAVSKWQSRNQLASVGIVAAVSVWLMITAVRMRAELGEPEALPTSVAAASIYSFVAAPVIFALWPAIVRRGKRKHPERFDPEVDSTFLTRLAFSSVPLLMAFVSFLTFDPPWWIPTVNIVATAGMLGWLAWRAGRERSPRAH